MLVALRIIIIFLLVTISSNSTHPVPRVDSSKRLTGSEFKVFYIAATAVVGYCSPDTSTFAEQCATADENFLKNLPQRTLHGLLRPTTTASELQPPATASELQPPPWPSN